MYFLLIIIYNASSKTFEFNCIYYYKCHVNKEDNLLAFREVRNIVQWLQTADFYSIISYTATLERDATENNRCVILSHVESFMYIYSLNSQNNFFRSVKNQILKVICMLSINTVLDKIKICNKKIEPFFIIATNFNETSVVKTHKGSDYFP